VLTHRVAYLIKVAGVEPWRIMAVTFTNKAAREMKERLNTLIGATRLQHLTIGTFHATCARILRREAQHLGLESTFLIYDAGDQQSLVRQALKELNLNDKLYRPGAVQAAISQAKSELFSPDDYQPPTYWHEVARRVYQRYQELLRANNALDFDDLLVEAVRLFRTHPDVLQKYQERYQHVLVDEFQDTNMAQYELVKLLGARHHHVFVVADEDQSIYSWRGADFRNITRFREDYPGHNLVILEQNYRSTQVILNAARKVIAPNTQRVEKKLWTDKVGGVPITIFEAYNEQEEADFVAGEIQRLVARGDAKPGDCAVMYRTNAQSRTLEDAFVRKGIRYKLVGATRFYERREIKDLVAYLRLVHNPFDQMSLDRIINVPPRGIGPKTISFIQRFAGRKGIPIYAALQMLRAEEFRQGSRESGNQGIREAEFSSALPRPSSIVPLDSRSRSSLLGFLDVLDEAIRAREERTALELLDLVIQRTGYQEYIRDGTREGDERWDNVQELRNVAAEFAGLPPDESLAEFLGQVALVSDVDNLDEKVDAVTLLTLHSAKGLEFPVVFITGLEDGLFPHSRSFDDPDAMEEERRLCYVGVTRAKEQLYLVYAFRRTQFGASQVQEPSRFLTDIPPELVKGRTKDERPTTNDQRPPTNDQHSSLVVGRSSFRPGDRVRHATFGEGVVISSKRTGDDEEVEVAFAGRGVKRLVASFARLEKT
jgi:DNA helicase-2/ATP-dependent DNA helicase PcrA